MGTTLLSTRLLDEMNNLAEGGAPLHISTLADTWIHLEYLVRAASATAACPSSSPVARRIRTRCAN